MATLLTLAERETEFQDGSSASRPEFRDVLLDQVKRLREELETGGDGDLMSSPAASSSVFRSISFGEDQQICHETAAEWMDRPRRAMSVKVGRNAR